MNSKPYSEDYKHFDNLIWQVPAWSTAVFAAVITALVYIFSTTIESIPEIKNYTLAQIFLVITGVFFISAYYSLYRWRVHQRYTKRGNVPIPKCKYFGAQAFLQFVTGIQLFSLICLFLLFSCHDLFLSCLISSLSLLIVTFFVEYLLNKEGKKKVKI